MLSLGRTASLFLAPLGARRGEGASSPPHAWAAEKEKYIGSPALKPTETSEGAGLEELDRAVRSGKPSQVGQAVTRLARTVGLLPESLPAASSVRPELVEGRTPLHPSPAFPAAGLEEGQFRWEALSRTPRGQIREYLDAVLAQGQDPREEIEQGYGDENLRGQLSLGQWFEILQWVVSGERRGDLSIQNGPDLYEFYKQVAGNPKQWLSTRTWAASGMARRAEKSVKPVRVQETVLLVRYLQAMADSLADAKLRKPAQRDLQRILERDLNVREAQDLDFSPSSTTAPTAGLEEVQELSRTLLDGGVRWDSFERRSARRRLQDLFLSADAKSRLLILETFFEEIRRWSKGPSSERTAYRRLEVGPNKDFLGWIAQLPTVARATEQVFRSVATHSPDRAKPLFETVDALLGIVAEVGGWRGSPAARALEQLRLALAGLEEVPPEILAEVQAKYGTAPYAVGMRVGGNNVSAGLVNAAGEVEVRTALPETNWRRLPEVLKLLGLDPARAGDYSEEELNQAVLALVPIPAQGKLLTDEQKRRADAIAEEVTEQAIRHVVALVQRADLPVQHLRFVHIAVPAPVDSTRGIVGDVMAAANLPGYDRYPLADKVAQGIRERLGVEVAVRVENDAPSGFKGEKIAGAGKDFERVASFIWGTGMNGTDFAGRWFELGHALVGGPASHGKWHYTLHDVRGGRPPLKPGQLELEQRLGGGAGLPVHWLAPAGFTDPQQVTELARQGDQQAVALIREAGAEFGRALAVVFAKDYETDGTILERFILVSGIGEQFGKGVQDAQGRDLLIGAIQDGVREELSDYFLLTPQVAGGIARAIVRSEWDSQRELAAAAEGLREIMGRQAGLEEDRLVLPDHAGVVIGEENALALVDGKTGQRIFTRSGLNSPSGPKSYALTTAKQLVESPAAGPATPPAAGLEEVLKKLQAAIRTAQRFSVLVESLLMDPGGRIRGLLVRYSDPEPQGASVRGFVPLRELFDDPARAIHYQFKAEEAEALVGRTLEGVQVAEVRFPQGSDLRLPVVFYAHRPIPEEFFRLQLQKLPIRARTEEFLSKLPIGGTDPLDWILNWQRDPGQWHLIRPDQRMAVLKWMAGYARQHPDTLGLFPFFQAVAGDPEELVGTGTWALRGMLRTVPVGQESRVAEAWNDLWRRSSQEADYKSIAQSYLKAIAQEMASSGRFASVLGQLEAGEGLSADAGQGGARAIQEVQEAWRNGKKLPVKITAASEPAGAKGFYTGSDGSRVRVFIPMSLTFEDPERFMSVWAKQEYLGIHFIYPRKLVSARPVSLELDRPNPVARFALNLPLEAQAFAEARVFRSEVLERKQPGEIGKFFFWLADQGSNFQEQIFRWSQDPLQWKKLHWGQRLEVVRWLTRNADRLPAHPGRSAFFSRIASDSSEFTPIRELAKTALAGLEEGVEAPVEAAGFVAVEGVAALIPAGLEEYERFRFGTEGRNRQVLIVGVDTEEIGRLLRVVQNVRPELRVATTILPTSPTEHAEFLERLSSGEGSSTVLIAGGFDAASAPQMAEVIRILDDQEAVRGSRYLLAVPEDRDTLEDFLDENFPRIRLWPNPAAGMEETKPAERPVLATYEQFYAVHQKSVDTANKLKDGGFLGDAIAGTWLAIEGILLKLEPFRAYLSDLVVLLNEDIDRLAGYFEGYYQQFGTTKRLGGGEYAQEIASIEKPPANAYWMDLFGNTLAWEEVKSWAQQGKIARAVRASWKQEQTLTTVTVILEAPRALISKARNEEGQGRQMPSYAELGRNLKEVFGVEKGIVPFGTASKLINLAPRAAPRAEAEEPGEAADETAQATERQIERLRRELIYESEAGEPNNHYRILRRRFATLLTLHPDRVSFLETLNSAEDKVVALLVEQYPELKEQGAREKILAWVKKEGVPAAPEAPGKPAPLKAVTPLFTNQDVDTLVQEVAFFADHHGQEYRDSQDVVEEIARAVLTRIDRNETLYSKFGQAVAYLVNRIRAGERDPAKLRPEAIQRTYGPAASPSAESLRAGLEEAVSSALFVAFDLAAVPALREHGLPVLAVAIVPAYARDLIEKFGVEPERIVGITGWAGLTESDYTAVNRGIRLFLDGDPVALGFQSSVVDFIRSREPGRRIIAVFGVESLAGGLEELGISGQTIERVLQRRSQAEADLARMK